MSGQSWTTPQNFPDLVNRTEKRLVALERRQGVSSQVLSIIGPAQNYNATLIGDWSNDAATNNGYFWSRPGALHSPDPLVTWTGSTIGRSDRSGMQQVWNTDDFLNVRYYMRTFVDDGTGQGFSFSFWRSWATPSGLIELPDIGPTVTDLLDDMAAEIDTKAESLKVYSQTTAPTNPDGTARPLVIGDTWFDTDDSDRIYVWNGATWVEAGAALFAQLETDVAAALADAEAAATAASDAMDFAETLTKTYRQSSAPTNPDAGGRALVAQDTWFDTSTSLNEMKRWSGSAWVSADVGFTDADLATPTVTGGIIQTTATAARGIKITSSGLNAYNSSGVTTLVIDASTGAITMLGALTTGSTIDGAVVTGGTLQTEATAARGIKINSSGMTAYNSSGTAQFTISASTGALVLTGALTGGGTITGPLFQTSATANTGIKISSGGLIGYNGTVAKFTLDASTGILTLDGGVLANGTITGAVVTGGTLQSEATAARGIKINSSGLVAYDGAGTPQVTLDAATGSIALAGSMTGGGTITGPTFQTASSGERIIVRNDGSGGIIESYSGSSGETPGFLDPSAVSSTPAMTLSPGRDGTYNRRPSLRLSAQSWTGGTQDASGGKAVLNGDSVEIGKPWGGSFDDTTPGIAVVTNTATAIGLGLTGSSANMYGVHVSGNLTTRHDVAVLGHLSVTGTGWVTVGGDMTFGTGWAAWSTTDNVTAAFKRVGTTVKIRGLFRRTSGSGIICLVLASGVGLRPSKTQWGFASTQNLPGVCTVEANGNVSIQGPAVTNNNYVTIDIEYDTDAP